MLVILDVFSGRPNPVWKLKQQQYSEFLKKISEKKISEKSNKIDGLGYRGLMVVEKVNEEIESRFEVNNGTITVFENKSKYELDDMNYEIEKWLLNTAPSSISINLLNSIQKEIDDRISSLEKKNSKNP
jgi:hypothetical protein